VSDAHLPPTGSVEVVRPRGASRLVERVASDTEDPSIRTERLLIALDVDGTVLLEDDSLSPGIVDAVEHAQSAGHEVMLATGRSWDGTRRILSLLAIAPEYVVCSNGAVVMRREPAASAAPAVEAVPLTGQADTGVPEIVRYQRFHTETFDPGPVLAELRAQLPDAHFMVERGDGRRFYTDHLDDWNLSNARQVPFAELAAEPVCRVVVVSPGRTEDDFVDLVQRIGLNQVSYAIGWTAWLDIAPKGVDKASALELVRGWLGVDPAHVLVIGDGRNDVGMFRWALEHGGRAVAMAQGPQEVRDAAGETTASVHEGGVAAILRAL
jgi:5-amino-6-(5-phospho-D-ribitylamino)uracil phosphatase